jgi:hypothetical protein
MNLSRLAVSLVLFSLTVSAGFAQQDRLLVTQKGTRSLAIVDPVAGTVIASVQEGGITGHEVVASADGRLAYVPIYGSSGVGMPGTDGQNLVVIDIAAQKVMGSVDFGRGVRPHMPLLGPKDHLLYVTTELDNAVTLIDPKTLSVGAVDGAVVEAQAEVLHRADGNRVVALGVGEHHGSFCRPPMARIADSGWLMMGVPNSPPKTPELVSVKVDPEASSGSSFLARARSARSAMARASSESSAPRPA